MTRQTVLEQSAGPPRRRWLEWFAAADPGETLLLHAVRATLAATASVVAAVLLTQLFAGGEQLTTASVLVLALVTSMLSMVLVSDATIRDQKVTTLLLVLPIAGSVVIATLVSPFPWLSGILLSACIFLAYYVRRFGARSGALGMIAVASFLTVLNTRATVVQMPWLLLTAALVVAFAYVFRFVILPADPARDVRRSLRAFQIRAAMTLDEMVDCVDDRSAGRTKRLHRSIKRLHLSVNVIEGKLASPDAGRVLPQARLDRLRLELFTAELSVEALSQALVAALDAPLPASLEHVVRRALQVLSAWSRESDSSGADACDPLDGQLDSQLRTQVADSGQQPWVFPVLRMESAIGQYVASVRQMRQPSSEQEAGNGAAPLPDADPVQPVRATSPGDGQPANGWRRRAGLRPTTQLAVKALLASAISLPIGYALSPAHPYFVLTAAYAVVTLSFGAVLETTLQQTLATVVGSLVGLGSAAAMYGIPDKAGLTVVLILAAFFLGVYLSPVSSAWPGFWLAVIFALLFNLAGGLEEAQRILVDQAIGTFAGCTVGLLTTLFVLPVDRTSSSFSHKTAGFLAALENQMISCVRSLTGRGAADEVEPGGRAVSGHFEALAAEAGALRLEVGVLGQGRRRVERQLLLLAALNSSVKQLAGLVIQGKRFAVDQELDSILEETRNRCAGNIDALRQHLLEGKQHHDVRAIGDLQARARGSISVESVLASPDSADAHSIEGLLTLLFLNAGVVELARELGASVVGQDETGLDAS